MPTAGEYIGGGFLKGVENYLNREMQLEQALKQKQAENEQQAKLLQLKDIMDQRAEGRKNAALMKQEEIEFGRKKEFADYTKKGTKFISPEGVVTYQEQGGPGGEVDVNLIKPPTGLSDYETTQLTMPSEKKQEKINQIISGLERRNLNGVEINTYEDAKDAIGSLGENPANFAEYLNKLPFATTGAFGVRNKPVSILSPRRLLPGYAYYGQAPEKLYQEYNQISAPADIYNRFAVMKTTSKVNKLKVPGKTQTTMGNETIANPPIKEQITDFANEEEAMNSDLPAGTIVSVKGKKFRLAE
jgi:hypothetical protein